MSPAPSIAVAGGGIVGLSCAWRLAQRGFRVTVFDQSTMGSEASWAAAGMLAPGGEFDEPSELAGLAIESRRIYAAYVREVEESSGFAIDLLENGALDLAYSAFEFAALEARAARQAQMGIESNAVAPAEVTLRWPRVNSQGLAGARFYPGDGLVNPREIVTALCAVCRNLGVRLIQNCAVLHIAEREQRVEVTTAQGSETHDAALVACGAWSSAIAIEPGPIPAATPVKGHLLGYQQPSQTCHTLVRHGHTYLMQRTNGLLIVGASVEHVGFDRQIAPKIVQQLTKAAVFVMPHLLETPPTEVWTGFRPDSDHLHVGRWQSGRVYLAYGHYRNGILLAPLTADRIAAEISANLGMR